MKNIIVCLLRISFSSHQTKREKCCISSLEKNIEVQFFFKLHKIAWLWSQWSFVSIIQTNRTSILFGKLECILKLSPCTKKGRGIKKSKKQQLVVKRPNISKNKWWTLRMQVTTNTLKLTEPPPPAPHTHTHSQLWSITTLSERVSREHGRRHLLSEMWRPGPCHLLAHCLRTTEQLSACVLMFACVCHAERHTLHVSPPPTWQQLSLVQQS